MPLLDIQNLSKAYTVNGKIFYAAKNVSFSIEKGTTLGLVGESGSGKTTIGSLIARLTHPSAGSIFFEGQNLTKLSDSRFHPYRSKIQIVFQDPYSSLNPRMTVEEILREPLVIHKKGNAPGKENRVEELLTLVGLPISSKSLFPHEFSGGQRQRISIARALALSPEFLILDEPISALDLSIRAQIINLLKSLQKTLNLTYLFIAHDLATVRYFCDDIVVLYKGCIVEKGPSEEVFKNPVHTYTQRLIKAVPLPHPELERNRLTTMVIDESEYHLSSALLKEVTPHHFVASEV